MAINFFQGPQNQVAMTGYVTDPVFELLHVVDSGVGVVAKGILGYADEGATFTSFYVRVLDVSGYTVSANGAELALAGALTYTPGQCMDIAQMIGALETTSSKALVVYAPMSGDAGVTPGIRAAILTVVGSEISPTPTESTLTSAWVDALRIHAVSGTTSVLCASTESDGAGGYDLKLRVIDTALGALTIGAATSIAGVYRTANIALTLGGSSSFVEVHLNAARTHLMGTRISIAAGAIAVGATSAMVSGTAGELEVVGVVGYTLFYTRSVYNGATFEYDTSLNAIPFLIDGSGNITMGSLIFSVPNASVWAGDSSVSAFGAGSLCRYIDTVSTEVRFAIVENGVLVSEVSSSPVDPRRVARVGAGTVHGMRVFLEASSVPSVLSAYLVGDVNQAVGDATLPMLTVEATGRPRNNSADITLPMLLAEARSGARAAVALPMFTVEATATVVIVARHDAILPMLLVEALASVTTRAGADISLPMFTVEARGGAVMEAVLPMLLAEAVANVGSLARADVTLPMLLVEAVASMHNMARADIVLPMLVEVPSGYADILLPMLQVDAVATVVVVITYEAYAVNLNPAGSDKDGPVVHEVTRYTNWPFNQMVKYQGNWYGVADDGLYLIGGATDYASPTPTAVAWDWHTHDTDFGSSQKKSVRELVIGGRLGAATTAKVSIREEADNTYAYANVRGSNAQNYRVKVGKGLKARYWAFGESGTGDGDIDTMDIDAIELGRKL